jgi:hypothetical protein
MYLIWGSYEIGSTKPLIHTMPKVQTSVSALRAAPPMITVKCKEQHDEDNYICLAYWDQDSDGEPPVRGGKCVYVCLCCRALRVGNCPLPPQQANYLYFSDVVPPSSPL